MVDKKPNFLVWLFSGIWQLINGTRKLILNVIFFALLLFVVAFFVRDQTIVIDQKTALVLKPLGNVVEQYSVDVTDRIINQLSGQEIPETLLREMLDSIERAKTDDRIDRLVIVPDYMWGIGFSKLQELKAAIEDFKTSGKQVLAYSEGMAQQQYYLAALADEIWLHPEGLIFLEGFSVYRNYYKEGLDKLEVDVHLFRVGEYKSAAEPYIRNTMSDESREANSYWMNDLWDQYLNDVASQRNLEVEQLRSDINQFADRLSEAEGRAADAAINVNFADRIASKQDFIDHVSALGARDSSEDSFRQIGYKSYLRATQLTHTANPLNKKVAVIVAQGPIVFGDQSSGVIGGESTARLIKQAQNDSNIAAIVLRVDSPGGSVLPSEKIRQQLALAKAAGKTIVVSMSSVAASGGYWVSMDADEIWANQGTITGSIGIFGLLTNFPRTLAKVGIHTDGIGTTPMAGAFRSDRELNPEVGKLIQTIINDGYKQFITKVATARELPVEQIDSIAQGRVWSGDQAFDRGLIDKIGGLKSAIASAAQLAGLNQYNVKYLEQEPSAFERFLLDMSARAKGRFSTQSWTALLGLNRALPTDLKLLMQQPTDRVGVYAYCFCTIE